MYQKELLENGSDDEITSRKVRAERKKEREREGQRMERVHKKEQVRERK